MTEEGGKRRLGRGLSALLGDGAGDEPGQQERARGSRLVPIEQLQPSRLQPRRLFDEEAMAALVESIREKGIIQPILVRHRRDQPNAYEIIAGERRWRAAQLAQLHEVPIVVREVDDRDALELALIENVQRQDLTPLEEAEGYGRLMAEFQHTQEDLAQAVGKSRSHVANMLRLLNLPDAVKALLQSRQLSAGHARALLNAPDPVALADRVVARSLSVRSTERLAREAKPPRTARTRSAGATAAPDPELPEAIVAVVAAADASATPRAKHPDTLALEHSLSNLLGLTVSIEFDGKGGTLTIHYQTLEQLDGVLNRLSGGAH
ncbi:MAG: ParB/RepB/Spo0J family partition protein [Alphaproteobacteria bacterium]|nr:ParB/RepB/Spo0J family partition protein [Alphaproteobacteria bacterium]